MGFLSAHGVAPSEILATASQAMREGVAPEAALLARGTVSPEEYYRLLARHLGLPFWEDTPALASATPWPEAERAGAAALQGGDGDPAWLLAPTGRRLEELFHLHRRGAMPRDRFAITTPERLAAAVAALQPERIAGRAANALVQADPSLSAVTPAASWQKFGMAAFAALGLAGLAMGGVLWLAFSLLCGIVLSGAIVLRLFAMAASCSEPPAVDPRAFTDADLPVYTVVVALYREAAIAGKLAAALERLDYPRSKLDIVIALEAGDSETIAAFRALGLPPRYRILAVPDGKPRTKPRALNAALATARGELICVYDAEDEPEPDQLRRAAAQFLASPASVACLQGRLAIDNTGDGWVVSQFESRRISKNQGESGGSPKSPKFP